MFDEEDVETGVRPPCTGEPPGPQTHFVKRSAGLCPSFSLAPLVSVEGDAPLDLEQKKRTQLQVKKKNKTKLAATSSSSSSGLGPDRAAAEPLLTPLRNDKFQQSKKSISVGGPRKHFANGKMMVGIMANISDAVTAAVAAAGGGVCGAAGTQDFSREKESCEEVPRAIFVLPKKEDYNKFCQQLWPPVLFARKCRKEG